MVSNAHHGQAPKYLCANLCKSAYALPPLLLGIDVLAQMYAG